MRLLPKLTLCLCFFSAQGQTSLSEALKEQMLKEWQRAKSYTYEYLDVMPAVNMGFTL
jgi:hypothetical protein